MMHSYEGYYTLFKTGEECDPAILVGADTLIGDELDYTIEPSGYAFNVVLSNKYGAKIGFIDSEDARKIQLAHTRGQAVHIFLTLISISAGDPVTYWGEVAVITFDESAADEFDPYVTKVAGLLKNGLRPRIDLSENEVAKAIEKPGWSCPDTVPAPKEQGSAVVKDRQSLTEKAIEQGRANNPGCWVATIAFWVLLIVFIFLSVKGCVGF